MSDSEQALISALQVAIEQHRAGHPARADALYRQLSAAPPTAPEALHLLGRVALKLGHQVSAADYMGRAVVADPEDQAYLNSYGVALRRLGRVDEALAAFRFAIRLSGLALSCRGDEILHRPMRLFCRGPYALVHCRIVPGRAHRRVGL